MLGRVDERQVRAIAAGRKKKKEEKIVKKNVPCFCLCDCYEYATVARMYRSTSKGKTFWTHATRHRLESMTLPVEVLGIPLSTIIQIITHFYLLNWLRTLMSLANQTTCHLDWTAHISELKIRVASPPVRHAAVGTYDTYVAACSLLRCSGCLMYVFWWRGYEWCGYKDAEVAPGYQP